MWSANRFLLLFLLGFLHVNTLLAAAYYHTSSFPQRSFALSRPPIATQPPSPPPLPYNNYFSFDGDAGDLIKSIAGPGLVPASVFGHELFRTTTPPSWTRATTPKDQIIGFMERTLDHFLSGGYQAKESLPMLNSNSIQSDSLLFNVDGASSKVENEDGSITDGSGEEPDGNQTTTASSITGIPKIYPNLSKVPIDYHTIAPVQPFGKDEEMIAYQHLKPSRPEVPNGGFGQIALADARDSNIRRHPGRPSTATYAPKSFDQFQYGSKPSYKQGLMTSILDFLGLRNRPRIGDQPSELDRVITEWLLQHSPTYTTKAERKAHIESGRNTFQKFLMQSITPLCTPQPETVEKFNVTAFMGQWFQVMHSPLMSSSSCSIMSYKILSETPSGVGSIFQTLEYSIPERSEQHKTGISAVMTSGDAVVSRPGQLIFRKSNSPEDVIVHVLKVGEAPDGRYDYAILSINCNYPLYVITRDPSVFKQKYEMKVNRFLYEKGLVNEFSQIFNIFKPVDFSTCLLPPSIFDSKM